MRGKFMTVEEVIGTLFQGEDQQLIQSLINISSIKQYSKGQVMVTWRVILNIGMINMRCVMKLLRISLRLPWEIKKGWKN